MWAVIVGSTLVSFAVTYAWWAKVRAIALRQNIYDVRDQLFDAAAAIGGGSFSDPAYREARTRLNGIAVSAEFIASGPALIYLHVLFRTTGRRLTIPETDNQDLSRAIKDAMRGCEDRIAGYVLHETALGLAVLAVASLSPPFRTVLRSEARRVTGEVVRSTDLSRLLHRRIAPPSLAAC